MGERFSWSLTCGVIETSRHHSGAGGQPARAGAISLTPFEAVSRRPPRGRRRRAVALHPVRVLDAAAERRVLRAGREHSVADGDLQPPVAGAGKPRDATRRMSCRRCRCACCRWCRAPPATSATPRARHLPNVESRRFRATAAVVGASIAFAFAAVSARAGAGPRSRGRFRVRDAKAVRPLSRRPSLRGCLAGAASARSEAARDGWTPPLMARALAALRIAGAVALGRRVAQAHVENGEAERVGQLEVRTGLLRRKRALLSAATTPPALLTAHRATARGAASRRPTLQPIMRRAAAVQRRGVRPRAAKPTAIALNNAVDDASDGGPAACATPVADRR